MRIPPALPRIARRVLPLLLALAAPAALRGQGPGQGQQVGSFYVERKTDLITDQDLSFAGVRAQGGTVSLTLLWQCLGEDPVVAFRVERQSGYGYATEMRAVWRFDQEQPESVELSRLTSLDEPTFLVPGEYAHAFTARIRAGSRLVVRVLNFGSQASDHVFDLTGSERALARLACMRNLRPPGEPPRVLGEGEEVAEPTSMPLATRADTAALIAYYTPAAVRERRGEMAVQAYVNAQGRVLWNGLQVTRSADPGLDQPAMFIASSLLFPPGRARRVTVYVYFSPTGGHIQVEDPG